jgi:hypothetical protein
MSKARTAAFRLEIIDCLFLFVVALLSSLPSLSRLGFYSDDWNYISEFAHQRIFDAVRTILASDKDLIVRPVQIANLALNYKLFGLNQAGYHAASAVYLGLLSVSLYLAVRKLNGDRWLACNFALVFSVLPHYLTDRVWFSSQQALLCMIFALLGLCALLNATQPEKPRRAMWTILSAICFILSVLAYEIAIGLILAALAIAAWRKISARPVSLRQILPLVAIPAGVTGLVLLVFLAKAMLQVRVPLADRSLWRFIGHLPRDIATCTTEMVKFDLWIYFLHMPRVLVNLYRRSALNHLAWIVAISIALGVTAYQWQFVKSSTIPSRRMSFRLLALTVVLFLLGYALFFSSGPDFTTSGLSNRITIAAALSAACFLIAVAALACSFLPASGSQAIAFSLAIGLICGVNSLAVSGLISFWANAAKKQLAALQSLAASQQVPPHGSTLLLDGFCPYDGPGIVFETGWDTTGAVRMTLHDFTLQADVVSPNLHFNDAEVQSIIYGELEYRYSYGSRLFVFNSKSRILTPLLSKEDVLTYIRQSSQASGTGCPPAREGDGEKIF